MQGDDREITGIGSGPSGSCYDPVRRCEFDRAAAYNKRDLYVINAGVPVKGINRER